MVNLKIYLHFNNDIIQKELDFVISEQPESVEEHFKLILENKALINSTHSNVTSQDLPAWFDDKLFKKFV